MRVRVGLAIGAFLVVWAALDDLIGAVVTYVAAGAFVVLLRLIEELVDKEEG